MRHIIILLSVLVFGCSQHRQDSGTEIPIRQFSKNIIIQEMELDQIKFEYEGFVGEGAIEIEDDKLLYLDRLNMQVIEFTNEGKFLGVPIANGNGPSEIPRFRFYTSSDDGKVFLHGYTYYQFNKANQLVKRNEFDFYYNSNLKEMESNPRVDDIGIYEVKTQSNQIEFRDGFLYTKIESTNPKFNLVMHKEYYENAPLYGKVDLKTGKVIELLGKRPAIYQNYNFIPHFDFYYHDFLEEEIYISFEPDSLIYILNDDFEVKEAFGNKGVGMDQSYLEVSNVDDWYDYTWVNRIQKGFYSYIKVIPEDELVFRTYKIGDPDPKLGEWGSNPQRMQIYHQKRLIGDVEVPNFFSVIGKIGDYYYADGSLHNRDNEEIVVYKFKLNY